MTEKYLENLKTLERILKSLPDFEPRSSKWWIEHEKRCQKFSEELEKKHKSIQMSPEKFRQPFDL